MESVITAAAMAAEQISTVVLTVSVVADTLVYVYQKNKTQQRERNYCKTKGLGFTSSCRRNKVSSLFSSTIIMIRK